MRYDPLQDERFFGKNIQFCREIDFDSHIKKLSKSSDCYRCTNSSNSSARAARSSVEGKCTYGRQIKKLKSKQNKKICIFPFASKFDCIFS